MRNLKRLIASLAPSLLLSAYHFLIAYIGAILYSFPSRELTVIGVTGTKGKSSTVEFVNAALEEAGYKTAVSGTVRFKIGNDSRRNLTRMSMPGRFFLQRFLRDAVRAGCTAAVIEMTSEGARQHRHQFIDLDALIFTNLSPEHIESHGSFKKYADTKFKIGLALARSKKRPRIMVAHKDDAEGARYLALPVERSIGFSLSEAAPSEASERGGYFTIEGTRIRTHLPGEFSLKNALAAALVVRALGVSLEHIVNAFEKLTRIPGRAEEIRAGQDFSIVVDYAHTPDSLRALYDAYKSRRKICILGSTGGGRDTWKRPVMGRIADEACEWVILTNEDPYDERPEKIVSEIAAGMKRKPEIVIDRRKAIRRALSLAKPHDVVLITGKGTDPSIMGPRGEKLPWSDAQVAEEEVKRLLSTKDAGSA